MEPNATGGFDLRGFEYYYFCDQLRKNSNALIKLGDLGSPTALAADRDGKLLAVGTSGGSVTLFSQKDGTLVQTLREQGEYVEEIEFHPSGDSLVVVGQREAQLFEKESGKPPKTIELDPPYEIVSVCFSGDGNSLALGHELGATVLDLMNNIKVEVTTGQFYCEDVALDYKGGILATSNSNQTQFWDVETGNELAKFSGGDLAGNGIAISPDDSLVAAAGGVGEIYVWEVSSGRLKTRLRGQQSVRELSFSSDNTSLYSVGAGELRRWNTKNWRSSVMAVGVSHAAALLGSGEVAFVSDREKTICRSVVADSRFQQLDAESVSAMAVSSKADTIAIGTFNGDVEIWDKKNLLLLKRLTTSTLTENLEGRENRIQCLQYSPDGELLAAGSGFESSGEIFVWRVSDWGLACTFTAHAEDVSSIAFITDREIASGGSDGAIKIWSLPNGVHTRTLYRPSGREFNNQVRLACNPQNGTVAAIVNGALFVGSNLELKPFSTDVAIHPYAVDINPLADELAIADNSGAIQIWNLEFAKLEAALDSRVLCESVRYSPDGERLAAIGKGVTVFDRNGAILHLDAVGSQVFFGGSEQALFTAPPAPPSVADENTRPRIYSAPVFSKTVRRERR